MNYEIEGISKSEEVYSFDVFDTCLTRNYSHPTDLFYDLAPVFLKRYCLYGYDDNSIKLFVSSRIRAERQARISNDQSCEDITLLPIYKQLKNILPWQFDIDEAMYIELQLELQCLRPILPIKFLIDSLREQGHRIVFISDMYLPSTFIKMCLVEHGIAYKDDGVYVSGEIGLSKHQGSLFHHVLKSENIQPSQLVHYGDNELADVKIPRSLGIEASLFKSIQLTAYEKHILATKHLLLNEKILLSKLVASGRYTRLSSSINFDIDNKRNNLLTGVIAPLLTAYVAWVLNTAKSQGVDRLYFVSRDGQVLFKIAQVLRKYIPAPECRYLFGSRQAWLLPSVTHCNKENLRWLTFPGRTTSVRSILARLEIEPRDIEQFILQTGFNVSGYDTELVSEELKSFINILIHDPQISSFIENKASHARALLGEYLAQEQFNDGTKWALVDVGWRLNSQQALKRVIDSVGWECQVKGYYLELANDHVSEALAGEYCAYFSDTQKHLSKRGLLIEHVFTPADHPTVIGYFKNSSGCIEPIIKVKNEFPDLIEYTNTLHKICCSFAAETAKAGIWNEDNAFLNEVLQNNALRLLKNPTVEDVQAIGWIPVVLDQLHNEDEQKKLVSKISMLKLFKIIMYEMGFRQVLVDSPYWLEGSAVKSTYLVKKLLFLLLSTKQKLQSNRN